MEINENTTPSTRDIIHAGFENLGRAKELLSEVCSAGDLELTQRELLGELAHCADPDVALDALHELIISFADRPGKLHGLLHGRSPRTLLQVLGASRQLGVLMRSRPELVEAAAVDSLHSAGFDGEARRATMLAAIDAHEEQLGAADSSDSSFRRLITDVPLAEATNRLRRNYYEQLAAIMAYDVSHDDPIAIQPAVSRALSDLADAALESALAIAQSNTEESELLRFTIIGMGKLGAQELNYVSDVDLIYVVEPMAETMSQPQLVKVGSKIAMLMQKICQSVMPNVMEPALWQIDGALRPEGKDGPLVRRLDSHKAYYRQWAESWEFQALLKARAVAGDVPLGEAYMQMASEFVWQASRRENFVSDCQRMRERVESLIPVPLRDREIKLGRGGLRDVEFTVQMLQLVHGRADETLHVRSTLQALQALSDGGYVSRRHARVLSHDYRFERVLEHRQQMWQLKRTHLFPDMGNANAGGLEKKRTVNVEELSRNAELHRLARVFGWHNEELVDNFDETRRQIRRLHNEIYYRPMLPISAVSGDERVELSEQAVMDRYAAIGFADPQAALRHVQALTAGITRAAKINGILLPAVLRWLGEGQNPDMGLLGWSNLEERFGSGSDYLGFLRDSQSAAQRLCHVLSNSRFLGDALNKSQESIRWLGDDDQLHARTRESLDVGCQAIITRYDDSLADAANMLRALRRHEIERIGIGWMTDVIDSAQALNGMTDVVDSIIQASLQWAVHDTMRANGMDGPAAHLAVIGMGRYGGREVNFSSDADVIIIYRPAHGADDSAANSFARKVQEQMRMMLMGPVSTEPKIELDMDLRPEGKNGPVVRSYASCEEYYRAWASVWERQALLRARFAAGDKELAEDFLANVANPFRYPAERLTDDQLQEIRRLKARMEAERLPRGVRRDRHLKLGRGGLSDVEWTVQLLQLQHAHDIEALQVNSTMQALDVLVEHGLIVMEDAKILRDAWQMCTAARNGNYLWNGRANRADILPDQHFDLSGIATYLGYDPDCGQQFENDILSQMRKSREVCERLFYGVEE
ncbi:bifunctional [glutamine synthetase] adenylyltransferase/[glutamine synthetase]-adenylyl-L-tyrosine phosphorylase [Bifidobacterium animalis]|uniref:bifunctional [glutamine synthetase] adenylyltransferase/[glutamine synthetase]-adenylyl-L-tyrosine phosphorylase n=1 Tax=Bifidobacterium animalis TaxID=28025 RepID=UPI003F8F810F